MAIIQQDKTVTRSEVQTVCGKVNIPKMESVILNLQLALMKDLEMVTLTIHIKIYSINVRMLAFVVISEYGIKLGIV